MIPPSRESAPDPTDEALRRAVVAALATSDQTSSLDLRVGVLGAVVHLAGGVASLEVREAVEATATGVAGVRGVVNRIMAPGAPEPSRRIDIHLRKEGET